MWLEPWLLLPLFFADLALHKLAPRLDLPQQGLSRESSMLGPSSPAGVRNVASSGTLSSVFLLIFSHILQP